MPTKTFWAGAAAGSGWDTPGNAAGEPDGMNTTATTFLPPFAQTGTLALSAYDFSALPDDAVISAISVVAHVSHDHTAARNWVVTIKNAAGDALGGVQSAFEAVPAGADHADETVVTAAGWASAAATKAALVAGVASVECIGIGDSEVSVEWSVDAVGVRVTYTIAPKPGHPMMNDTCTIRRKITSISAATGTPTHEWEDWSLGVPCSVQADSSSESGDNRRESGRATYRVYLPYGTDVQTTDRLVWQGRTLSVVGPPVDGAGRRVYYRVPAEEETNGGQR